jgi:superoxide dismutase, Fe-Mn family
MNMPYAVKPLSCDPKRIKGMSERLIVSHYENNYGGAVKRLNLIAKSSPTSTRRAHPVS